MVFLLLAILAITLLYLKITNSHRYWLERGVQQNEQTFLFGDSAQALFRKESTYSALVRLYNLFPEERYIGIYEMTKPILLIRDPELIQQVYFEAFDYFTDRRDTMPEGNDPIWTKNLSTLSGEEWLSKRRLLNPSFNSKKMEDMFGLIAECVEVYIEHLKRRRPMKLELKDTFSRFSNDVIASIAFGVKRDSINVRDDEFYTMSKALSTFTFKQNLIGIAYCICPRICKAAGLSIFDTKTINYFKNIITENIRDRREKRIWRPDMVSFLLDEQRQSQNGNSEKTEISDVDIAAQAFMFFYSGFDTVSTSLVFLVYELSINSKIQAQLQKEIDAALGECGGKPTYDSLANMKYLDQVVSESLRKWPPAVGGDRICTKSYTIQPAKPSENRIELNPGDLIWISIAGIQNDPRYFPRPRTFNPDRFSEENKHKIVPNTYLPFGIGSRNCIGRKIAIMEIKTLIFYLLSKFNLMPCSKERIRVSASSYDLKADGRIWIMLRTRKKQ